jgi:ankyrin repeat protein
MSERGVFDICLAGTCAELAAFLEVPLHGFVPFFPDKDGNTPLHVVLGWPVKDDILDWVQLLLRKGASIRALGKHSCTPLRVALTNGQPCSVIELLVAPDLIFISDLYNACALSAFFAYIEHFAVPESDAYVVPIVKLLLENAQKSDMEFSEFVLTTEYWFPDDRTDDILFLFACEHLSAPVVEILLDAVTPVVFMRSGYEKNAIQCIETRVVQQQTRSRDCGITFAQNQLPYSPMVWHWCKTHYERV